VFEHESSRRTSLAYTHYSLIARSQALRSGMQIWSGNSDLELEEEEQLPTGSRQKRLTTLLFNFRLTWLNGPAICAQEATHRVRIHLPLLPIIRRR
jgi:hypothetical protein